MPIRRARRCGTERVNHFRVYFAAVQPQGVKSSIIAISDFGQWGESQRPNIRSSTTHHSFSITTTFYKYTIRFTIGRWLFIWKKIYSTCFSFQLLHPSRGERIDELVDSMRPRGGCWYALLAFLSRAKSTNIDELYFLSGELTSTSIIIPFFFFCFFLPTFFFQKDSKNISDGNSGQPFFIITWKEKKTGTLEITRTKSSPVDFLATVNSYSVIKSNASPFQRVNNTTISSQKVPATITSIVINRLTMTLLL